MKKLKQKILVYFSILMLCFSFSNESFSQIDITTFSFSSHLFAFNKNLINNEFISISACTIPFDLPVEELLKQALIYNNQGNWQCCKTILNSISDEQIKLSKVQTCHFHLVIAEYFTLHQIFDSAHIYASLANDEAGQQNLKNEKAQALLLLSAGDLKQRNISSAYAFADSALTIARQTGNNNLEAKILFQLALCIRRHFTAIANRSFSYFLMAREKASAGEDSVTLATIDLYIATDYFEIGKWEEGFPYIKECMFLSIINNNVYVKYMALISLGYTFQLTQNYHEGLLLFIKALKLSQQQQNAYNIQHCYHDISRCYLGLHQYDSAIVYANLAGKVPGVDSFWANVWDTKAAIYNNMGNYKMASTMFKKSEDWYREDFLYRNQDQLSGYEAKLNTKEKELQVTQQKKRSLQLEWMIGGVGGLLIISAFAFAMQQKAKGKLFLQNNLIQKQRGELEQSLAEKEILLKEIHHRVKNNLSIISSLLELQSNGIDDEAAKAAIVVGQNRVSSIALIHQRLYQHENLAAIELSGFLHDLFRQISSVFKKPGSQIQMEINVPETLLDIDTAVPLGLILNELLTNSYKYAFDDKNGLIKIDLQQQNTGEYFLIYADNGPGIAGEINIKNITSLGLRLIHRLSKQLGGSATYKYNNGSTFIIHFKNKDARIDDK